MGLDPFKIDTWSEGQLRAQVAASLNNPMYVLRTDDENAKKGYPVSIDEMKSFLREHHGFR